jgi:GTP-binding protein
MQIKSAEFLVSNTEPEKSPKPDKPEYAFIGRSNVGKSSLINMLVSRHGLAKTSGTPGKTQLINHFVINDEWYLVDLPGYGYAQVGKGTRAGFARMIDAYLTTRPNLICTFVLIDGRIAPQKIDLDFITRLGEGGIPFVIVFTKTEKIKSGGLQMMQDRYKAALQEMGWDEIPQMFLTSASSRAGQKELLDFIEPLNKSFDASELREKKPW